MTKAHQPNSTATVHAAQLKRALAFVQQVIERRITIPVLGMVRIDFSAHQPTATVTATDLDIELQMEIDIDSAGPDDFTLILPPTALSDFLRPCAADVLVTFTVNAERVVTITADGCAMTIRQLCQPEDWQNFNGGWEGPGLRVNIGGDVLHRAIAATAPCISTEETRYYLNGIYLHTKGNGLVLCATDGHRMSVYKTDAPYPLPDAILPAKTAKILQRALGKSHNRAPITVEAWQRAARDGDKSVLDGAARMRFSGHGWTIRSKTIDGTYPDYTRVTPKADREVKITATITAHALRRLPTLTRFTSQAVKIEPSEGCMSVACDGITAKAPVTGHGEKFGLNISYLRGMTYPAETIKLIGLTGGDPFIVQTDDPQLLQVIMPMRV